MPFQITRAFEKYSVFSKTLFPVTPSKIIVLHTGQPCTVLSLGPLKSRLPLLKHLFSADTIHNAFDSTQDNPAFSDHFDFLEANLHLLKHSSPLMPSRSRILFDSAQENVEHNGLLKAERCFRNIFVRRHLPPIPNFRLSGHIDRHGYKSRAATDAVNSNQRD